MRWTAAIAALLATGCPSPPPSVAAPGEATTAGAEGDLEHDELMPLVITAIDVGQGDCTLVECPNGAEILIDCGSSARGDRDRVAALLAEHVEGDVEVLVVTHPDADHINFLAPASANGSSVLGNRRVARALLSLDEAAYRETNTGDRLMDWLAQSADEVRFLTPNDASAEGQPSSLFDCGDTAVYVLAASEPSQSSDRALQRNTPSIVLLLERALAGGERFRAMLTGDATRETEAAILARYSPAFLDVDLLKVGHHGALTSTIDPDDPTWRWLAVTSPRYAITTTGHHGGHRHPRCAVTDAILDAGSLEGSDDCHAIECGEPTNGRCAGAIDGAWCGSVSSLALFNSVTNGDVACAVDGAPPRLSIQRGTRVGGCGE